MGDSPVLGGCSVVRGHCFVIEKMSDVNAELQWLIVAQEAVNEGGRRRMMIDWSLNSDYSDFVRFELPIRAR